MHHFPSVLDIIVHTPIWAWALFALVIYLGFARTRDRTVALWRLLLLPVIMVVASLSGLVGSGFTVLPAMLVGFAVGGVAGWLMERPGATRRLPDGRLWLRGEWSSLVLILVVVVFRYATTVVGIVAPAFAADPAWSLSTALVSSFLAALFLARTIARLRVYFTMQPVVA